MPTSSDCSQLQSIMPLNAKVWLSGATKQSKCGKAGEPPAFPHFDCFVAPDSHTFAFKGMIDCNWLQSLEVGIDPVHTSFLHRFFHDEDPAQAYGKMFRDTTRDSDMPMTQIMREVTRPRIEVEDTDYGFRLVTLRQISDTDTHVRVTNLVFPNAFMLPMSREMTISQWHVPVDDEKHYWLSLIHISEPTR